MSHEEVETTTREQVIRAATDVLVDGGLEGFSTPVISRVAGVSQGAVLGHFATEQELLVAAVAEALRSCTADYQAVFVERMDAEDSADPISVVRPVVETLWAAYNDERTRAVLEVRVRCRTDPGLRAALDPVVRTEHTDTYNTVALLLPEAFSADPRLIRSIFVIVLNALHGRMVLSLVHPDPDGDEELIEDLVAFAEQQVLIATQLEPPG